MRTLRLSRALPVLLLVLVAACTAGGGGASPSTSAGPSTPTGLELAGGVIGLLTEGDLTVPGGFRAGEQLRGGFYSAVARPAAVVDTVALDKYSFHPVLEWFATQGVTGPSASPTNPVAFRAGPGAELVLAQVRGAEPENDTQIGVSLTKERVSVRIRDSSVVLGTLSGTPTLVVAAPLGAPVLLVVEESGHVQSVDLRTGKRVQQEAAFYRPTLTQNMGDFDFGYPPFGLAKFYLTEVTLTRTSWGLGFPPAGKAWLVVRMLCFEVQGSKNTTRRVNIGLRAGGKTLRAEPATTALLCKGWSVEPAAGFSYVRILVPADFQHGTLTVTSPGSTAKPGPVAVNLG